MSRRTAPQVCAACGAEPRRALRLRNGSWLLRCPRCLLGWWDWLAFEPAHFYDREYFQSAGSDKGYDDYAALEAGLRRTSRARLKRIARLHARRTAPDAGRPSLLDLGCGTGCFLDQAQRAGWDVEGIEVSEYAASVAQRRGMDVRCQTIETAAIETNRYDCVTLWDTLEHLRDPVGVITSAAAALRPGGVLALSTGDITSLCARLSGPRWHLFNLPEHLFFFSPESLRRILQRAGCRVATMTRETYWATPSYLMERLAKSARRRRRLPGLGTAELLLPATLLDVLGVYALRSPVDAACPAASRGL